MSDKEDDGNVDGEGGENEQEKSEEGEFYENEEEESDDEKNLMNDTGLSDSEEEAEEYDPKPYIFVLKDIDGQRLILPPETLKNAQIPCPSFHVLLDHTIAVLWCYYSGEENHKKLGTAQLHWALKFLEGLVDRESTLEDDLSLAIENLEDALVDIGASVDDDIVNSRNYNDYVNESYGFYGPSRDNIARQPDSDDEKTDKKKHKDKYDEEGDEENDEEEIYEEEEGKENIADKPRGSVHESQFKPSKFSTPHRQRQIIPSIVIHDMLNAEEAQKLLDKTMKQTSEQKFDICPEPSRKSIEKGESDMIKQGDKTTGSQTDLVEAALKQLETIQETLRNIRDGKDQTLNKDTAE